MGGLIPNLTPSAALSMPTRPHSISELAQFAKDESLASSRGIKDWLRVADALRKQGHQAIQDGDNQGAFLFLARSATYILEKIPHHPSYHELNPTQMTNLKNNGHDILHSLEQLKPRLADRYEQWLARDPRNAEIPSQLQSAYGGAISPVVVSRARRQDSRDSATVARPAVSSDSGHTSIRQTTSIGDLSRDLDGMRIVASPETRRPRSDTMRRMQEEAERRQWQEQADMTRRREEEEARIAEEQAARRQWELEQELDRRAREEQRRRVEYDQSQRIKNAALDAARQAAGYNTQNSRYRESNIASSTSPVSARSPGQFDALPHHPLQDPTIIQDQSSTPIWHANRTPTATRSQQPLYKQPSPLDVSFNSNIHIQYPQLMSAHQRAQGYQPSVMFPSPQTSRGGSSSSLYNISLPQQSPPVQYPPPRTSSMPQVQYSPAPPGPAHQAQAAPSGIDYPPYDTVVPSRAPRSQQPAVSGIHKRQSSMQEIPSHPLGLRPIDMPVELLDRFLGVARLNTLRKIETCGLLLGQPRGAGFSISTLLIPEQRGTPDTCIMESEELVVEFSTGRDMLTLGWIHTHPTQSCFMSSLDLHTHAAYQSTLKEAIAIVCAPTSDPKFGIFRLTDPPGLDAVMTCRAKETFHPHPEHLAIYTDCDGSHVRLVSGMHLEIVDLRRGQDFSSSEGTRDV